MWETGVVFGERVVLLSRIPPLPFVPARALLPGVGRSLRERARAAVLRPDAPVPSGRGRKVRQAGGRTLLSETDNREILLPGRPDRAARVRSASLGLDPAPADLPAARRLDLFGSTTKQHGYEVLGDWGYWQARVAQLADTSPGSELAALLEERPSLADEPTGNGIPTELGSLRAQLRLDSMAARHRLINALQGDQYADAAALAVEYPAHNEFLSAEVALALETPESVAGGLISTGFTLATKLPRTLEALQEGQITVEVAQVMVGGTAPVTDPALTAAIEEIVLPKVAGKSREWVRREVVRQVIRLDPAAADERHEVARKKRSVTKWADVDGMGWMKVHAPIEAIAAAWEALTGLADAARTPGDQRTLDQRRADVFAGLFHSVLDRGGWDGSLLPTQHGRKAHVGVLVPYDLIGAAAAAAAAAADAAAPAPAPAPAPAAAAVARPDMSAHSAAPGSSCAPNDGSAGLGPDRSNGSAQDDPAPTATSPASEMSRGVFEVVGYGPIAPGQGMRMAAEGDWRRIVCDPLTGTVMDYGRTRYIPPGSLRRFIVTRDQSCSFFGCSQPAWRSQIDHVVPYSKGGPTAEPNLCALCLHHHRAKDGGGFSLTLNADRSKTWTTPLGRTATVPPTSLIDPTEPTEPPEPPEHTGLQESPDRDAPPPDQRKPDQPPLDRPPRPGPPLDRPPCDRPRPCPKPDQPPPPF